MLYPPPVQVLSIGVSRFWSCINAFNRYIAGFSGEQVRGKVLKELPGQVTYTSFRDDDQLIALCIATVVEIISITVRNRG